MLDTRELRATLTVLASWLTYAEAYLAEDVMAALVEDIPAKDQREYTPPEFMSLGVVGELAAIPLIEDDSAPLGTWQVVIHTACTVDGQEVGHTSCPVRSGTCVPLA